MADVFCVHCHRPIQRVNFALGPGWTHIDNTFGGYTYCQNTAATPPTGTTDTGGQD